jgi:hypothetical protein
MVSPDGKSTTEYQFNNIRTDLTIPDANFQAKPVEGGAWKVIRRDQPLRLPPWIGDILPLFFGLGLTPNAVPAQAGPRPAAG